MDKRYIITKPAFKAHYAVRSADGQDDYHIPIKTKIKPSQPRLTFHSGSGKHAPIVAILHFQAATMGIKLSLGDPAADMAVVEWEDLSCLNKVTHARYAWSAIFPSAEVADGLISGRRTFVWTRTRSQGIDGTKPTAVTNRHWKLSEEGSKDILALFTGQAKIGQCGTLAMREDLGEKLHRLALVTLIGLYESALLGLGVLAPDINLYNTSPGIAHSSSR